MRISELAIKDLRQIARDRKSFMFLLVMPIAFTLLFGFAFGGNSTADSRLPVGLVDEDGSALSQQLVTMLAASEVVRIELENAAVTDLQQQVADKQIAAAILIPAGFGAALLGDASTDSAPPEPVEGGEAPLAVTIVGGGQSGFTIEEEVQTGAARL